jgi:hypothetical protein
MPYVRVYTRHQVKIDGKIMSPDLSCFSDCVIKDISEGGAMVTTPTAVALPDRVYLYQERTKTVFECEVRWRKLNLIGLRFIDATARAKSRAIISDAKPVAGILHAWLTAESGQNRTAA